MGSAVAARIKKMTRRTRSANPNLMAGSKLQLKSRFLFIRGWNTQVKKNSTRAFFIIANWCPWSWKELPDHPCIHTFISNLTNYFGNPIWLLSRSEFMVSYTLPKLSLRLITVSKNKFLNRGATFQGLSSVSCSPPMACSSHLSVPLNYGLFILR